MRTWTLVLALALGIPALADGAPCVPASLADYVSLGAGGCSIGNATFFDFSASTPGEDTPISPDEVQVAPLSGALGLDFILQVTAGPGEAMSVFIGYSLTGPPVTANVLSLSGTTVSGDGVVLAVEEKCLGDVFAGDAPSGPCLGTLMDPPLIVFDIGIEADFSERAPLAATTFFDVFTQIVVDGGLEGSATLNGTVTNRFETAPEPSALLLLGAGVALAAMKRRRGQA